MINNTGGPAFPYGKTHTKEFYDGTIGVEEYAEEGMTLRDYFAAKAMQAILNDAEIFWDGAAPLAYQYADAMLKARES